MQATLTDNRKEHHGFGALRRHLVNNSISPDWIYTLARGRPGEFERDNVQDPSITVRSHLAEDVAQWINGLN